MGPDLAKRPLQRVTVGRKFILSSGLDKTNGLGFCSHEEGLWYYSHCCVENDPR